MIVLQMQGLIHLLQRLHLQTWTWRDENSEEIFFLKSNWALSKPKETDLMSQNSIYIT